MNKDPSLNLFHATSPQFDVCYIEIPGRSLNDAQLNAEYVAAAIQILAPQSKKNGKLFIIGHSQGNIVSAFPFELNSC
jgi:surfactin synthase thioesterase subunit